MGEMRPFEEEVFPLDLAIVRWVSQMLHTPLLDRLMPLITMLGNGGWIWLAICVILLCRRRTRRWGVLCALSMFLTFLAGEVVLKNLVQRLRPFYHLPELELLIPPPGSFSFPSGHSGSSFAAAASVWRMDRRWGRWALALAVLIGFSRLYLSVHYLTDILAGSVLGLLCAWLAAKFCNHWERWHTL